MKICGRKNYYPDVSNSKSSTELLKTETPYFPNNSIKVLFINPVKSAACPDERMPSSYNFEAIIIASSLSPLSTESGMFKLKGRGLKLRQ